MFVDVYVCVVCVPFVCRHASTVFMYMYGYSVCLYTVCVSTCSLFNNPYRGVLLHTYSVHTLYHSLKYTAHSLACSYHGHTNHTYIVCIYVNMQTKNESFWSFGVGASLSMLIR